jgi:hypothetical protein
MAAMEIYRAKCNRVSGTSLTEVKAAARREYHAIQKRTPRRIPYVRSGYFAKDKIFLNTFWDHLKQKHPADQLRRLKFYAAAIDLIRCFKEAPETIFSKDDVSILLHRYQGVTKDGHYFCVQIKQNKRTGRKEFISVFPANKKTFR